MYAISVQLLVACEDSPVQNLLISGKDFERFWNWFGKSEFPGVLSRLKLTFSQHYRVPRKYRIVTTSCWVSEDDYFVDRLL